MTPRPRADRTAKRAEFASAAALVFAERGVANTAVSDIVRAAGVAQGTFYLYFDSKEDVVLAVVERMADDMAAAIERATSASPGTSAVEKLLGLGDVLARFDSDPAATEMAEFIHRRENRALHDRLTEHLAERLAAIVEGIVAQGVAENDFTVADVSSAAWFVLGGLQSVELRGLPAAELPAAIEQATVYALRALGYQGELE